MTYYATRSRVSEFYVLFCCLIFMFMVSFLLISVSVVIDVYTGELYRFKFYKSFKYT